MRSPRLLFATLIVAFCAASYSQPLPRATIVGRVLDDSTRSPLPLTNVFISNSTIGTATDSNGRFELKGVPVGAQQVVASLVGYQPGVMSLQVRDTNTVSVEIRLRSRPIQMPGVEVEAQNPVEWKKKLEKFVKEFIGSTDNADKCRLLNPEVLDFAEESGPLTANAREALEIENRSLGYYIRCVLIHFASSRETMQFIVLMSYRLLQPKDAAEENLWRTNRLTSYQGSMQHFLRALLKGNVAREGFDVNLVKRSLSRDALSKPVGFEVNTDTLLKPGEFAFQKKLSFPDFLQVIHANEGTARYTLIEMNRPKVTIYPNGLPEDPWGFWTYGYWSTRRIADMLPIDYEPR